MNLKRIFYFVNINIPTFINSIRSGISYNSSNIIRGKIKVIHPNFIARIRGKRGGQLTIGSNFKCNNTLSSNSIGCFQPCVFNIVKENSKINIGNNVGISGTTIKANTSITIGNNVLIGSGCLICDNDSHPIDWKDREEERDDKTLSKDIIIEDHVFIGARSIILKGVKIGFGSVIGAGSVVTKSIPPYSIAAGNPAKVLKSINP